MGFTREEVETLGGSAPPQQSRSKVEFAELCGSLEELAYLGEGSNGVVYSASWHGARVAVKFLLGKNDDSTHLQRCFTEAVLTRVLSHPCVVQCFATAIAQLTPEMWEAIRARCRRHQSILQSSSLGRSVAAAVLQQREQEHQQQLADMCDQPLSDGHPQQEKALAAAALPTAGSLRRARPGASGAGPQQSLLSALRHQQTHPHQHAHPQQPQQPPPQSGQAHLGQPRPGQQQQHQQQCRPAHRARSHPQLQLQLPPDRTQGHQARAGQLPSGISLSSKGATLPSGIIAPSGPALSSTGTNLRSGSIDDAEDERERARGRLEMRKVDRIFFAEEDEVAVEGRGTAAGARAGKGECGRPGSEELLTEGQPTGDADVDVEADADGEVLGEGVSLLQALIDLKAESGRHCTVVVMEYMDAGTLHQAIVRGDFSARRSLEHRTKLLSLLLTAQELAQGMAHLHGLDILHGDLKPTNVLLKGTPCQYAGAHGSTTITCIDPRGYTAKIADLGLARTCSGETAQLSSDQWGALAYLAPEAAKGSCCKASDVYSFGVMLWEMAAGVRPYMGLTTPQVLMGLVTGTLQLTWPSNGSLYAPLRSLATACTDFNAAERPTFEVAARVLGRMVRHIRSSTEPLRQRHSSALSMEIGGAVAGLPGAGSGGNSASGGKCVLNHASRSMPLYMPTALASASALNGVGCGGGGGGGSLLLSSLPPTPSGPGTQRVGLPGIPPWLPVAGQVHGPAGRQHNGGGEEAAGAVLQGPGPVSYSCGGARPAAMAMQPPGRSQATTAAAAAVAAARESGLSRGSSGRVETLNGTGSTSGSSRSGPVADTAWVPLQVTGAMAPAVPGVAEAVGVAAQSQYPRMRRGCGGNVCGGPVRSKLGGAASLRMLPSPPLDEGAPVWTAASPPQAGRPGSSPAHTHVS